MKIQIVLPLLFLSLVGLRAQPAQSVPPIAADYQALYAIARQQRDGATQALQDAQIQLYAAQQKIAELSAKVAELEKAKAKPEARPPKGPSKG